MKAAHPKQAERFHFAGANYDPQTGEARLSYAFDDGPLLTERIVFPYAPWPQEASRQAAFLRALDLLHLIAGVSYYKAGLPPAIDTGDLLLDDQMAGFLTELYERGLGEFAHVNELDLAGRIRFEPTGELQPVSDAIELPERALIAMGGGKDSLVSLELLRAGDVEMQPVCVGTSPLIAATVQAAGLPLLQIHRTLAPELADMNAAGAWNGHVPVTAICSAILVCAACLYGHRYVVFSNERSAEEATLTDAAGREVNHQYSKSLAFERALRSVLATHVSPGVEYFSLLRPLGELAVARRFSMMRQYHPVFSSCNRNFHLDGSRLAGRWCLDCPKCRFTSLVLAPFMAPGALAEIVGANLLDDPGQEMGYRALCGLGHDKPFECVGTLEESRAAMAHIASHADWARCCIPARLARELPPGGASLEELQTVEGPHCIPREVLSRVDF